MPFIYGTLVSSFLALLLAVPLSVGVAVYVTEMCPIRLRAIISFLVELLAAIPSVIYGLWAIFVLAPLLRDYVEPFLAKTLGWTGFFSGPMYGIGMLAAGIILAIMIVPIIASITREVLTAVPQNQREAVLALGATRWEMIRMGVLRNARIGIVGGVILGLGSRAGRNHGGHHGHRQPSGSCEIAVRARLHHGERHRQRVHRSHRRPLPERPGRNRTGSVPRDADRERAGATAGVEHHRRNGREGACLSNRAMPNATKLSLWRRAMNQAATWFADWRRGAGDRAADGHLRLPADQGSGIGQLAFLDPNAETSGRIGGGMANAIVGTGLILAIASVLGIPLGIGCGIYLAEYGRDRFGDLVRFTADVLNGVPSIVIGIAVYSLIVIRQKHFSAFSGGVALGIMMIPTIARATEEMLLMVPNDVREAALGLGIPKWRTTLSISLRTASAGVITGCMLAFARVAGETAPLLFTAFGNQFWNMKLNQPTAALSLQIFTYAISPYDDWHKQAWAGALILIVMIVAAVAAVRIATSRGTLKGAS